MSVTNWAGKAQLVAFSSETEGQEASHVMTESLDEMWLSQEGMPQFLLLRLPPRAHPLISFAWHCWNEFTTNPRRIEISISHDGVRFVPWDSVTGDLTCSMQIFPIDPISPSYEYVKLTFSSTFGASQVYVNRIGLFQEDVHTLRQYFEATMVEHVANSFPTESTPPPPVSRGAHDELSALRVELQQLRDTKVSVSDIASLQETLKGLTLRLERLESERGNTPRSSPLAHPRDFMESMVEPYIQSHFQAMERRLQDRFTGEFDRLRTTRPSESVTPMHGDNDESRIEVLTQQLNEKMRQRQETIRKLNESRRSNV